MGIPGTTNLLKVEIVSSILAKGTGIGQGSVAGRVKAIRQSSDLSGVEEGDILVAVSTDADMISAMKKAKAIVTEEAGLTSHGAIVGMSLGKPVLVGARDLLSLVADGDIITIDFTRGVIYHGHTQAK